MTLQEQLLQAKTEYHKLITGIKPRVVVDQNGERVEFSAANAGRLKAYIHDLENQIKSATVSRGPMRPFF